MRAAGCGLLQPEMRVDFLFFLPGDVGSFGGTRMQVTANWLQLLESIKMRVACREFH